jgi:hypothetical protein
MMPKRSKGDPETTTCKKGEDKPGMRYKHFAHPRRLADFAPIERYWFSLGWQPLNHIDEMRAIRAGWTAKFGDYGLWGADPVFPPPSRSWDISPLYPSTDRSEAIEAQFTMKMLAAFRRCVTQGERLLVIGHWQLDWYEFDPHGGVTKATRDEWARPVLTDEAFHFVARDLSYGTHRDWRGRITIFGRELFAALEPDPPGEFLGVCRLIQRPCA